MLSSLLALLSIGEHGYSSTPPTSLVVVNLSVLPQLVLLLMLELVTVCLLMVVGIKRLLTLYLMDTVL